MRKLWPACGPGYWIICMEQLNGCRECFLKPSQRKRTVCSRCTLPLFCDCSVTTLRSVSKWQTQQLLVMVRLSPPARCLARHLRRAPTA